MGPRVKVENGGQVEKIGGILKGFSAAPTDDQEAAKIELWIYSNQPDYEGVLFEESLSYLTIEETINLCRELNKAVQETIEKYIAS